MMLVAVWLVTAGMLIGAGLWVAAVAVFIVLLAGVGLIWGSLRVARLTRLWGSFLVPALTGLLVILTFRQPLGLSVAELRFDLLGFLLPRIAALLVILAIALATRELSREPLLSAVSRTAATHSDLRYPAFAGAGLAVLILILLNLMLGSESAWRVTAMVQQQVGPAYQVYLGSLSMNPISKRRAVTGIVTYWNDKELKHAIVQWQG